VQGKVGVDMNSTNYLNKSYIDWNQSIFFVTPVFLLYNNHDQVVVVSCSRIYLLCVVDMRHIHLHHCYPSNRQQFADITCRLDYLYNMWRCSFFYIKMRMQCAERERYCIWFKSDPCRLKILFDTTKKFY